MTFKPTPSKDKCIQGLLTTPYCGFADLHQHLEIIPKRGRTMKNEKSKQKDLFLKEEKKKNSVLHT